MTEDVLVVIVNYRGHSDTLECLESLLRATSKSFKVVIVDNSENDLSVAAITEWAINGSNVSSQFPLLTKPPIPKPVSLSVYTEDEEVNQYTALINIFRCSNKGFAAANNVALKKSASKTFRYYWLLNNDTVVEPTALAAQISCMEKNSETGILGSKLRQYFQPHVLQGVGGRYNKWLGKVVEIGGGQTDHGQWDTCTFELDYVIGASMFVRKEFVERVGLMEENFFLYYEELDWALRGKSANWRMGYCPQSIVYHKMGASINKQEAKGNSITADFYSVRNRILVTRKYFPYALLTLYPAFIKFIFNRIRLKQFSRIPMMLKILLSPSKKL